MLSCCKSIIINIHSTFQYSKFFRLLIVLYMQVCKKYKISYKIRAPIICYFSMKLKIGGHNSKCTNEAINSICYNYEVVIREIKQRQPLFSIFELEKLLISLT